MDFMDSLNIKLQLGGEEFWWQSGYARLRDKDAQDIRQLLALSKAVTSSLEWELSAREKEKQTLSECFKRILEGVQKINQSVEDFAIPQGSEKESFFISIFNCIYDSEPCLDARKEWYDQLYINSLKLICKYTTIAHVFFVVHVISKNNFKRLGVKGAPKLVQWVYSNKDKVDCSVFAHQVDQITKGKSLESFVDERLIIRPSCYKSLSNQQG